MNSYKVKFETKFAYGHPLKKHERIVKAEDKDSAFTKVARYYMKHCYKSIDLISISKV